RKVLVSLTEDNVLKFWDAVTTQAISPPLQYDSPVQAIQFSPDGLKLLVVTDAHVEIINLKSFDRSTEELVLLSRVISGLEIDQRGSLEKIAPAKRQEYWQTLQAKYGR